MICDLCHKNHNGEELLILSDDKEVFINSITFKENRYCLCKDCLRAAVFAISLYSYESNIKLPDEYVEIPFEV